MSCNVTQYKALAIHLRTVIEIVLRKYFITFAKCNNTMIAPKGLQETPELQHSNMLSTLVLSE